MSSVHMCEGVKEVGRVGVEHNLFIKKNHILFIFNFGLENIQTEFDGVETHIRKVLITAAPHP